MSPLTVTGVRIFTKPLFSYVEFGMFKCSRNAETYKIPTSLDAPNNPPSPTPKTFFDWTTLTDNLQPSCLEVVSIVLEVPSSSIGVVLQRVWHSER